MQVGSGFARVKQRVDLAHQVHIPREEEKPGPGVLLCLRVQPLAVRYGQRTKHREAAGFGAGKTRQTVGGERSHCAGGQAFARQLLRWQVPGTDAAESSPGHIGTPAVPNEKNILRAGVRLTQKGPKQLAAALLHAVICRDKTAVQKCVAAFLQHGIQLGFGQIHVGDVVDSLALRMQCTGRLQHRQVGHGTGKLGGALSSRVIACHAGAGVDISKRHFPAFGGAGLGFGPGAGFGEIRAQHRKQVGGAGCIALDERIKHIKGHHRVRRSLVQKRFSQFHGSMGISGAKRTPAKNPFHMMPMRQALRPCGLRSTCTVCQASFASSHSQPRTPSRR